MFEKSPEGSLSRACGCLPRPPELKFQFRNGDQEPSGHRTLRKNLGGQEGRGTLVSSYGAGMDCGIFVVVVVANSLVHLPFVMEAGFSKESLVECEPQGTEESNLYSATEAALPTKHC